jgi:ABC-type multidrug transport system fused ATPase/permease subunit
MKMQVFFALTMMAVGVSQSSSTARDFSKVGDAAVSIFGLIDRKSKIDASSEEGMTLVTVQGNIELQHVSFKYPARNDVQIFRDLCLRIPSSKVTIVFLIISILLPLFPLIRINFILVKCWFILIELLNITI